VVDHRRSSAGTPCAAVVLSSAGRRWHAAPRRGFVSSAGFELALNPQKHTHSTQHATFFEWLLLWWGFFGFLCVLWYLPHNNTTMHLSGSLGNELPTPWLFESGGSSGVLTGHRRPARPAYARRIFWLARALVELFLAKQFHMAHPRRVQNWGEERQFGWSAHVHFFR
jgi:hypothetical protein